MGVKIIFKRKDKKTQRHAERKVGQTITGFSGQYGNEKIKLNCEKNCDPLLGVTWNQSPNMCKIGTLTTNFVSFNWPKSPFRQHKNTNKNTKWCWHDTIALKIAKW